MSFPYKILNDLSAKLKAAEENVEQVRKHYEAKITGLSNNTRADSAVNSLMSTQCLINPSRPRMSKMNLRLKTARKLLMTRLVV